MVSGAHAVIILEFVKPKSKFRANKSVKVWQGAWLAYDLSCVQ